MKALAAALAVGLLLTLPAVAQDKTPTEPTAPPTPPAAAPPAEAAPPAAPAPSGRQVLDECRDAAVAKGLDEAARRRAIATCIIQASPKIARRIHCLMDPKLRGLDNDARMAAIAECIQTGQ